MTNNETMKDRFMARYNNACAGIQLFKACIDMLESIKEEDNSQSIVEEFIKNLSSYEVYEEEKEETKQILSEFTTKQMSKTETVAYFNYLHDTAYSKAHNMLLIQDIFKCYF